MTSKRSLNTEPGESVEGPEAKRSSMATPDSRGKPTKDNLMENFTTFMKNLLAGDILPYLFQKNIFERDVYTCFRKRCEREVNSKIVEEILLEILEKLAQDSSVIQSLHDVLVETDYGQLAELLCTTVDSSSPKGRKEPKKSSMVQLDELDSEQEQLSVAVTVQVVHRVWRGNCLVDLVVAQGDHAKHLRVLLQTRHIDEGLLTPGCSLVVCNGAWTGQHLVASSRDLTRTGAMKVSQSGLSQASSLFQALESAERKSIGTKLEIIADASVNSTFSTTVDIATVEHKKQLVVDGESVERMNFHIKDCTGEMAAELWRSIPDRKVSPGQKWYLYGKVIGNNQKNKVFRVLQADCIDDTGVDLTDAWLSSDGHKRVQLLGFKVCVYDACSKKGCSFKKLETDKQCKKCGSSYAERKPVKYAYANLQLLCGDEVLEVKAFLPEISQLYTARGGKFDTSLPDKQLEEQVLQMMPLQCGVIIEGEFVNNIRCEQRQA